MRSITSLLTILLELLLFGFWDLGLEVVSMNGLEFLLDGGGHHLMLLHERLADESRRLDSDIVHLPAYLNPSLHELDPTVTSSTLIKVGLSDYLIF